MKLPRDMDCLPLSNTAGILLNRALQMQRRVLRRLASPKFLLEWGASWPNPSSFHMQ